MDEFRKFVSGRLQAQVAEPHPDPDVLSAFAENALPESERAQLLQHLGACNDCREILYLAAPDSAEAQKVLSFQPKRGLRLAFRWGALMASVVIVGAAVIARYPVFHARSQPPAAANAPVSNYSKVAEEKAPAEAERMRDALRAQPPAPSPSLPSKERPEPKHMTAKPQAGLEFDDSGQVRISSAAVADETRAGQANRLSHTDSNELPMAERNVVSPPPSGASQAKPGSPPGVAGVLAKDRNEDARADNPDVPAGRKTANGNLGGTVIDASGAVVGNAKITTSGPVGAQTATSDADGRFSFDRLTPGVYSIKAEANGFKPTEISQVAVLDNKTSKIGVRLEPGSTSETVEVTAAAPAIDQGANAAAGLQVETTNGSVLAQKQTSAQSLKKEMATNSPQRAKASRAATPTPQWTLSAEGAVQRSLDAGKSWQKVSVTDGTKFRALCAVGTHIWAGGNAGALFHSVDSGQSWTQVVAAVADQRLTADITHIDFTDPASGAVSTANGEVWSTSNGGQSWRRK
jgi:hypothetical protein